MYKPTKEITYAYDGLYATYKYVLKTMSYRGCSHNLRRKIIYKKKYYTY